MSIEDQRDLVIEALVNLLHGALNASDGLGASQVLGKYDEPMSLKTIGNAKLPALCVYRASDQGDHASNGMLEVVTVNVDLFLRPSSASTGTRSARWPALVNGWTFMRKALMAGHHPEVEDDARVLDIADINVERDSFKAPMYGFADDGTQAFPILRATFQYTRHITGRVNTALVDLLRVRTVMDLNEDLPTEAERQATVDVEFTGPWPAIPTE